MSERTQSLITNRIFYVYIAFVITLSILLRLLIFEEKGGDHSVYKRAVTEFISGINPYIYTIQSYTDENLDHGYAYPPTLLYILSLSYVIGSFINKDLPMQVIWKVPTLLADLGVCYLIYKIFFNKSKILSMFVITIWLLNPHFIVRYEYTLFDTIQIFFLLSSFYLLNKNVFFSAIFYSLAISFKVTPIIFLPLFLTFSNKRKLFILTSLVTLIAIALPFMGSTQDFLLMLKGGVLVHSERTIQGRPVLSFVQYLINNVVNFRQNTFFNIYALLALTTGPAISLFLIKKKNFKNIYALASITAVLYYIFTPLLNRTHILWFYPIILLGIYELVGNDKKRFLIFSSLYFIILSTYLMSWGKGLTPIVPNANVYKTSLKVQYPFEKIKQNLIKQYIHGKSVYLKVK